MPHPNDKYIYLEKNVVKDSTIEAETVHIGDKVYYIFERKALSPTLLFLHIHRNQEGQYQVELQLNGEQRHGLTRPTLLELDEPFFRAWNSFEQYQRKRLAGLSLRQGAEQAPLWAEEGPQEDAFLHWEKKLGLALYEKCFPAGSAHRQRFEQFLELLARRHIDNLCLLASSPDARVLNLPFALMRQALQEPPLALAYDNFLIAHTTEEQLSRFERSALHGLPLPLRILFVTALPQGSGQPFADLEAEQEQAFQAIEQANRQIIQALGDLPSRRRILIEFLEVGALPEVSRALKEGKHHVLHIAGHGFFFDEEGRGFLNLETEEGALAQVSSEELARALQPFGQHLKLVLFSACETGRAEAYGIAGALTRTGMPAVIGMRYPLQDETATRFTAMLYEQLCQGAMLSEALFHARHALEAAAAEKRKQGPAAQAPSDWFTPTLYLNQYAGKLVDVNAPLEESQHFFQHYRPRYFFTGARGARRERTAARLVAQGFVGRRRQLAKLNLLFRHPERYSPEARTLCIYGMGGLGKTTLAARFIDNYQNKGFKVIPFVGAITEQEVLLGIAKSAGDEAAREELLTLAHDEGLAPLEKLNMMVDGFLEQERAILFFDNFEDNQLGADQEEEPAEDDAPDALRSGNLESFLTALCEKIQDSRGDNYLLITTRYPPAKLPVYLFGLGQMSFPDTYKFISRFRALSRLGLQERRAAHERLGGHPRALELLDSYFRNTEEADWPSIEARFPELEGFLARHDLLLELLWRKLTAEEQEALAAAAVFRYLTPADGLAAVLEAPGTDFSSILERLDRLSLLYLEDGHFFVHRLTGSWLSALAGNWPLEKWHDAAGEFLLHQETNEEGRPVVDTEGGENVRWHFLQAAQWEKMANMTLFLEEAYRASGNFGRAMELLEEAGACPVGRENEMIFANRKGVIYKQRGQYQEAIEAYNHSETLCREAGHHQGVAANLREIGSICLIAGDFDTALEYFEESIQIAKENELKAEAAAGLLQCGILQHKTGKLQEAMQYYSEGLSLYREADDYEGIGHCLHQMGRVNEAMGAYDQAMESYVKSMEIAQELEDLHDYGISLHHIGTIHLLKGNYEEALQYSRQSLDIAREYQDVKGMSASYDQIGTIYRLLGRYEEAVKAHERGYQLSLKIGNIEGVLGGLANMGMLYHTLGQTEEALHSYQQTLATAEDYEMPAYAGAALHQMGNIALEVMEEPKEALAHYQRALTLFENLSDLRNIAATENQKGRALIELGLLPAAEQAINKALALRINLGEERGAASCIHSLGLLAEARGDYGQAIGHFEKAYQRNLDAKASEEAAVSLNAIGTVYEKTGDYQKALEYGTEAILLLQQCGSPLASQAAQSVLELEDKMPPEEIFQYLKSKGLDIQYIEPPAEPE